MITCQTFRANLTPNTDDVELLAHMRSCDACIDHAMSVDPDNFFRAIGGNEMIPPGGVDAFASEVMAQIRSRETETSIEHHVVLSWPRRFAIAATIAASFIGTMLVVKHENAAAPVAAQSASLITHHPSLVTPRTTKPVIETYQSQTATIIEVPAEGANVVMIFDDKLPADL